MNMEPGGGIVAAPKPAPTPAPTPTGGGTQNVNTTTSYGGPTTTGNSGQHPWDTDPGYVQAQADYNRFQAEQDAWLRAQRAQAQNAFNGAGNQFSYMAGLGRADQQRIQAYKNSLAARGILQSGEYGYQTGQENLWRSGQQYAGEQQLLGNLNSYLNSYMDRMSTARSNLNAALQTAYQNWINDPNHAHWSDPNSPGGWFPFNPTPNIDPATGLNLGVIYTK